MSLENAKVVDAIGIEDTTGFAVLTIADSWDWQDEQQHLAALQEKLNTYFDFIGAGEVFSAHWQASGTLRVTVASL